MKTDQACAILRDLHGGLLNCYACVSDAPKELLVLLQYLQDAIFRDDRVEVDYEMSEHLIRLLEDPQMEHQVWAHVKLNEPAVDLSLRVTLDLAFATNGVSRESLALVVEQALLRTLQRGAFTMNTGATLVVWDKHVEAFDERSKPAVEIPPARSPLPLKPS
jgi:hypothetical protein